MAKSKALGQSVGVAAKPMDEEQEKWESKRHFDTLMEADEIRANPDKMAKVHKLAGRHAKAIKSIQDLKTTFDDKFGKGALKKR